MAELPCKEGVLVILAAWLRTRRDDDGLVLGVHRDEANRAGVAFQLLHGGVLVIDEGDDDVAVLGRGLLTDDGDVAVEDAREARHGMARQRSGLAKPARMRYPSYVPQI